MSYEILNSFNKLLTLYEEQLKNPKKVKITEKEKKELIDCAPQDDKDEHNLIDVVDFMDMILNTDTNSDVPFFHQFFGVKQVDNTYANKLDLRSPCFEKNPSVNDYMGKIGSDIKDHFNQVKSNPSEYLIVYPSWMLQMTKGESTKTKKNQNKEATTTKIKLNLTEMATFGKSFLVNIGHQTYRPVMVIYMPFDQKKVIKHFASMIYETDDKGNPKNPGESIIEDDLKSDWTRVKELKKKAYYGVPRVILFKNEEIILDNPGIAHLKNDNLKCFLNSALQLFSRIPAIHYMLSAKLRSSATARPLVMEDDDSVVIISKTKKDKETEKTRKRDTRNIQEIQKGVFAFLSHKISTISRWNPATKRKYGFRDSDRRKDIQEIANKMLGVLRP